jgi:hypothetical protein
MANPPDRNPEIRWRRGNPPRPGRYAVTQGGASWFAANWTEDFGWFDGYQRVLHVKAWCEVPPMPAALL